jgi:site-specific DNA-cytosine methylase
MVVDKSKKAQKFILANTADKVQHFFSTVDEHISGFGHCFICNAKHSHESRNIDVRVWSPPCQPYSAMRHKHGTTASTVDPEDHPLHNITVSDLPEMTEFSKPLITLVEQVPTIMKPLKNGRSPFSLLMSELEKIYGKGAVAAVTLDSALWMEGHRNRTFSSTA